MDCEQRQIFFVSEHAPKLLHVGNILRTVSCERSWTALSNGMSELDFKL